MELYQSLVAVEPATLIVTICNLFLQIFIVKKFLLDKVLAVLDKRRETADLEIVQAQAAKDEAMAIIGDASDPQRKAKLMNLDGGRPWNYLYKKYFPF